MKPIFNRRPQLNLTNNKKKTPHTSKTRQKIRCNFVSQPKQTIDEGMYIHCLFISFAFQDYEYDVHGITI